MACPNGDEKKSRVGPYSLLARAEDGRRGSTNEEVETFRTPVFKTADAELCGIDACRWIKSPSCANAEGRAFCQSDFAHQIFRIRRNHGADAALVPAGFCCHCGRRHCAERIRNS